MRNDKSLFFMTLSLICVWVILDNIYGKRYLDIFLSNIFSFYGEESGLKIGDFSIGGITEEEKAWRAESAQNYADNMDGNPNDKLTPEEEKAKDILGSQHNYSW